MARAYCEVCLRPLEVSDDYDPWRTPALCNPKGDRKPLCVIVNFLFNEQWSDQAVHQREFFDKQRKLP